MKPYGFPCSRTLKDGSTVTIRLLETTDAKALLDFYRALPEQDRQFLDDDVSRPEWVDRFIRRSDFDTCVPIVAEAAGRILGHAWLIRNHYGWMSHVGQLRLAVARDHQRKGLGATLVREVLRIANDAGLEKMTVRMMDTQESAIRMFQRLGFQQEAVVMGILKDLNGRRRNLVIMANDISRIWQAMESLVSDTPPDREMLGQ